jgi:hypothetical protein
MPGFFDATLGGLLGSSISTAVLGALFLQRNKTIEAQVNAKFDVALKVLRIEADMETRGAPWQCIAI